MRYLKSIAKPGMYLKAVSEDRVSVIIYSDIYSGWTDSNIASDLKDLKRSTEIDVYINSYGGDAWSGIAIFNTLARFDNVSVYIDGHAESAASIVAMAGSKIEIAQAGQVMIHNAWTFAYGDAQKFEQMVTLLRSMNDRIASIYAARTGNELDTVLDWMNAETTFTADEAVELGFATDVAEMQAIAAKGGDFKKDPRQLLSYDKDADKGVAKQKKLANVDKKLDRVTRANLAINESYKRKVKSRQLLAELDNLEKGKN